MEFNGPYFQLHSLCDTSLPSFRFKELFNLYEAKLFTTLWFLTVLVSKQLFVKCATKLDYLTHSGGIHTSESSLCNYVTHNIQSSITICFMSTLNLISPKTKITCQTIFKLRPT